MLPAADDDDYYKCFGTVIGLDYASFNQAFAHVNDPIKGRINSLRGTSVTWNGNTVESARASIDNDEYCGMSGTTFISGKEDPINKETDALFGFIKIIEKFKSLGY
jgi:hypothetical protein